MIPVSEVGIDTPSGVGVNPWTCPRCGALVHDKADIHAFLCSLYRKQREAADAGQKQPEKGRRA